MSVCAIDCRINYVDKHLSLRCSAVDWFLPSFRETTAVVLLYDKPCAALFQELGRASPVTVVLPLERVTASVTAAKVTTNELNNFTTAAGFCVNAPHFRISAGEMRDESKQVAS